MITVNEIAKLAGVSATTVSLCFKEKSRISENTRKKVLEIASKHGYFPNKIAQILKKGSSNLVGIVVSEFDTPFMQEIVTNAERYLSDVGYKVMIFSTYRDLEKEKEALTQLMEFQACGLIVCACERENDLLSRISKSLPTVCVDSEPPNVNSHYIIENMTGIVKTGLDYLLSLGHEKILFINGSKKEEHFKSFKLFNDTSKEYLKTKGIELGKKYFINGGIYIKDGYNAIQQALWQNLDFSAVFCISDNVAVGVMEALDEKGISIPEEVSVLGVDDSEMAKLRRINLTTIVTTYGKNYMHIGEMAADLLIKSLRDKDYPLKKIIMEPKLVVRGSCK